MLNKKDIYRQAHYRIDFGYNRANQVVQTEVPELTQYDSKSGLFVFDFYNEGRRVNIENTRVLINFTLPNGAIITDEVTNVSVIESRAYYNTPSDILIQEGLVVGNISLSKNDIQITSPVKFNFMVVDGIDSDDIIEHEKYPILTKLISQVDEAIDRVNQWDEQYQANYNKHDIKFRQKYDSITSEFNEKSTGIDSTFATKMQNVDTTFENKSQTLDTQFNEKGTNIDTRFNQKYEEIDAMFHQSDVDAMFQDKFQRLEQEFAQDYTDMKQTVGEVFNTTLKYRYVD